MTKMQPLSDEDKILFGGDSFGFDGWIIDASLQFEVVIADETFNMKTKVMFV